MCLVPISSHKAADVLERGLTFPEEERVTSIVVEEIHTSHAQFLHRIRTLSKIVQEEATLCVGECKRCEDICLQRSKQMTDHYWLASVRGLTVACLAFDELR